MSLTQRPPNYLLQALPAADFDALHPHFKTIEMVRKTVLVEAGSVPAQIYLPHSGAISMTVGLSGGQVVEVAMIGRDGLVGASAALGAEVWTTDAVVLLPGTASVIDVADLKAVADRNVTVRSLLARHELALFAEAQQSVACNASHSVEARLSRWLLRARDLSGDEVLPLTQEFLAQMIGVRRNAISMVAHALQQAGTIRYRRGRIAIVNVEALRKTSCECYHAVKAAHDRLLRVSAR
jgi:CRP-like cAMP-binding protein